MESSDTIQKKLIRHSKQEIQVLIEQWQQSGITKKSFCATNNLNYQTFIGWVNPKNKKKKQVSSIEKTSDFIPVEIKENARTLFAEARFNNGNSVCIYEYVGTNYLRSLLM